LEAKFYYSFDNGAEIFEELIDFSCEGFEVDQNLLVSGDDTILDNFLFQMHLALGISYYKLFPTKTLEIKSGYLDDDQIIFWEKFYRNGLGEFFITNEINPNGLLNFINSGSAISIEELTIKNNYIESSANFIEGKTLLLWGGGKDSIVSYSLLKDKKKLDLFVFGKVDAIKKSTAEVAEENILLVKRTLSKNLFKLNQEGYYNGHVPITGIIAFATFVVGYLYGYSNIVLSNEASASESNTEWKGIQVNHQYSKSLEFEQDLLNYSTGYISKGIRYFSLLRGMYEYKIAEIFSKQRHFHKSFSSCNRNFVISSDPQNKLWCCECEKCCFVFLILSAHLNETELIEIFGENLFDKPELENTFRELIGLENHKPFECVGTYEECLLSAKKTIKNIGAKLPIILESLRSDVEEELDTKSEKKLENKLLYISSEDIIPEQFKKLL
ncbi:hypothetical protein LR004_02845, partial [Candidatus Gracilibacteria bacterium]|nr:hypothetical protein [Candidatus Gracilibacteria bacterium]